MTQKAPVRGFARSQLAQAKKRAALTETAQTETTFLGRADR